MLYMHRPIYIYMYNIYITPPWWLKGKAQISRVKGYEFETWLSQTNNLLN